MVIETKITVDHRLIVKVDGKRASLRKAADAVNELEIGEPFTVQNHYGFEFLLTWRDALKRPKGFPPVPAPYGYPHLICLRGSRRISTGFVDAEEAIEHLAYCNC